MDEFTKRQNSSGGGSLDSRLETRLWLWLLWGEKWGSWTGTETETTFWHGTKGDADYLNTRDQGEQVETLWELGETIRHLTREEGQVTWNKRRKLVIFQNKTGNDETRHKTEQKPWHKHKHPLHLVSCFLCSCHVTLWLYLYSVNILKFSYACCWWYCCCFVFLSLFFLNYLFAAAPDGPVCSLCVFYSSTGAAAGCLFYGSISFPFPSFSLFLSSPFKLKKRFTMLLQTMTRTLALWALLMPVHLSTAKNK